MGSERPVDPGEVWRLIQRADDLLKYAQNRDPAAAYAQARKVLGDARSAADALEDEAVASRFREQIEVRLGDLQRLEAG